VLSAMRRTDALTELSDEYSYRVNLLLDEGREDLARKLAEQYEREGLSLLVEGAR
jgi:phage shock protein A